MRVVLLSLLLCCLKGLFFPLNTLYHLYRFDNPLAWLSTLSQNSLQPSQVRLQILLKRCWRDKRSLCELRKMHLSNVILYIDLCFYWNWNNMHKLFKLKAGGPRIPQSRIRGQTERGREGGSEWGSKRNTLELDLLCFWFDLLCFTVSA